ncbi:MAG: hypothetical protein LBC62_04465 [Treponema sp.]|jgi:hypothetical protein|nr:hypothetical protein [Treponema sp.]
MEKTLRDEMIRRGDVEAMNLCELAAFSNMPGEVCEAIRLQAGLALTYLEDGAAQTAANVLRGLLGEGGPYSAPEWRLADCLTGRHSFQFQGAAYEHDPRTGYCYRLDNPLRAERKAEWRRIAQEEYAEKRGACLEAIEKQAKRYYGGNDE